jgi:2-furoate---CoA ligase
MLDLGASFFASVARDPDVTAIVDGSLRLTYAQWYAKISSVVAAFDALGLESGDHIVTVLQNRWEAATIHWACQFTGIIITPINWRANADELDFCTENAEAEAVIFQQVSAEAVERSNHARGVRRIAVGEVDKANDGAVRFDEMSDWGRRMRSRARTLPPGRSCSTRPVRPRSRKACRAATSRSAPRASRMSHRISTGAASERSA